MTPQEFDTLADDSFCQPEELALLYDGEEHWLFTKAAWREAGAPGEYWQWVLDRAHETCNP